MTEEEYKQKKKQLTRDLNINTMPGSEEEQELFKQLGALDAKFTAEQEFAQKEQELRNQLKDLEAKYAAAQKELEDLKAKEAAAQASARKESKKRYDLRSEPFEVSEEEYRKVFGLNDERSPLQYIENEYEDQGKVILDHATGLMWQISGSDNTMKYTATQAYIDSLNNSRFAGFNDWRLPTIPELMSLLEPEEQSNWSFINPVFDSQQNWCWSADKTGSSSAVWGVHFDDGVVRWDDLNYYYVRAVRSVTN